MALLLRNELKLYDASNASFYDRTGTTAPSSYGKGGNITYADVDAVRIKIATYLTLTNVTTLEEGDTFVQFTEYVKKSQNTSVINGKTFTVGAVFVPQVANLVVPADDTWETTGYYVPQILDTWLPTASETALNLNVTEFGQGAETDATIQANIYGYDYEVYKDISSVTFAAVNGAQYLVVSGSASYDSDTYIAGEIIEATDTTNITIVTGEVARLDASNYAYSVLINDIMDDINTVIQNQIGKNNQDIIQPTEGEIFKIRAFVESLEYAAFTKNVSLSYCYRTILFIQDRLTLLLAQ